MSLFDIVNGGLKDVSKPTPLGTTWVAPGEGSTWRELFVAFSPSSNWKLLKKYSNRQGNDDPGASRRTNLKLTGAPIQPYDRQRWESGNVE